MKQISLDQFEKVSNRFMPGLKAIVYNFLKSNKTEVYDSGDADAQVIAEFLYGHIIDPNNKVFHEHYNLTSIAFSAIPDRICYWNLEFTLKGTNYSPKWEDGISYYSDDDGQPYPSHTFYLDTLYITIIGLC